MSGQKANWGQKKSDPSRRTEERSSVINVTGCRILPYPRAPRFLTLGKSSIGEVKLGKVKQVTGDSDNAGSHPDRALNQEELNASRPANSAGGQLNRATTVHDIPIGRLLEMHYDLNRQKSKNMACRLLAIRKRKFEKENDIFLLKRG